MYGEMFRVMTNYYHGMLNAEIHINEWVQERYVKFVDTPNE